jgi:hypothetical protein
LLVYLILGVYSRKIDQRLLPFNKATWKIKCVEFCVKHVLGQDKMRDQRGLHEEAEALTRAT